MKHMKKFMALFAALALVMAMAVPAFADGSGSTPTTYTITAPATSHQYEVYQIFTGELENGALSNVKWGQNAKLPAGKNIGDKVDDTVLKDLEAVNSRPTVEKLAAVEQYVDLNGTPVATITNGNKYSAVAGYYLIKDKDGTVPDEDAYTTYIVQVVGNVNITPKSDVPSFEKKLKDKNDSDGTLTGWQDVADWDIGDSIPFKLEGKVASNYTDYEHYYFAFHDVEESTLTFDKNSVKVYVDGTLISTGYRVIESPSDGCTFEVVFNDLKTIDSVAANSVISVEYSATLNSMATIGGDGNQNKASLEFSNNPKNNQHSQTPWDYVLVFTYKMTVNKYANEVKDGNELTGAQFKLEKKIKGVNGEADTWTEIPYVEAGSATPTSVFTFKGLDDGEYRLTETVTPSGYNTMEPITFKINADHTIEGFNGTNRSGALTSLSGNQLTGEISFTSTSGDLSTNIINHAGTTLPSTGGIGTTIFYVVGGGLMVAAAVLLVAKKRMENK